MTEYKPYTLRAPAKPVCWMAPFGDNPDFKVVLTKWPTRWQRFWFRALFGWKFKGIGET